MGDKVFNLLGSLVVVLAITALVLPGRQTSSVFNAGFGGLNSLFKTASGQ